MSERDDDQGAQNYRAGCWMRASRKAVVLTLTSISVIPSVRSWNRNLVTVWIPGSRHGARPGNGDWTPEISLSGVANSGFWRMQFSRGGETGRRETFLICF
jgi:hypothetical protein